MGGNAIKKGGKSITGRLPAAVYEVVKRHVMKTVAPFVTTAEIVLEIPGKTSFGDMDVLYVPARSTTGGIVTPDFSATVIRAFGVEDKSHLVRNGPCTSFALPIAVVPGVKEVALSLLAEQGEAAYELPSYFQIDLIKTVDMEHLESARFYLAYSDIGGIMGRIFHFYGLKFGDVGLWCEVFANTVELFEQQVAPHTQGGQWPTTEEFQLQQMTHGDITKVTIGKLTLTKNPKEICEFAGLDYAAFFHLSCVEEMYAWLAAGRLFSAEIFNTLNCQNRHRAATRPVYIGFLDFIGKKYTDIGTHSRDKANDRCSEIKCNMQLQAIQFLGKQDVFTEMVKKNALTKARNAKFNGGMLLDAIAADGILDNKAEEDGAPARKPPTGAAVGKLLQAFKDHCSVEHLRVSLGDVGVTQECLPVDATEKATLWKECLDAHSAAEMKQAACAWVVTEYLPFQAAMR